MNLGVSNSSVLVLKELGPIVWFLQNQNRAFLPSKHVFFRTFSNRFAVRVQQHSELKPYCMGRQQALTCASIECTLLLVTHRHCLNCHSHNQLLQYGTVAPRLLARLIALIRPACMPLFFKSISRFGFNTAPAQNLSIPFLALSESLLCM